MKRRVGGAVTQRSAKPRRWVQLPYVPPLHIYNLNFCADGGIGRHERLKISWLHGRAGSSPALRTKIGIFPEMSLSWAIFWFKIFNSCHRQKPLSAPALEVVFGLLLFGVWVRVLLYNERATQFTDKLFVYL